MAIRKRKLSKEEAEKRLRAYFLSLPSKPYGIATAEEGERIYRALYRAQGGRCYVCRKAKGESRLLAIDHDHVTGEIRGLVCSGSITAMTCNRVIAIYTRAALLRAVAMLSDPPPARAVLSALRDGGRIPSLVGGSSFTIEEVMSYGSVHVDTGHAGILDGSPAAGEEGVAGGSGSGTHE